MTGVDTMNPIEASARLGIPGIDVLRMMDDGRLPRVKDDGGAVVTTVDAVEAIAAARNR